MAGLSSLLFSIFVNTIFLTVFSDYPFNDPSLPWDTRVNDLVSRLTVEEITQQMANGGRLTYAPGIDRLGIKPYPWGSECLRGDVQAGSATSFPQAIGLAATFSSEVVFNVSRATGLEVRAKFNNYSAHGDYGQHTSASCWSPVINIMRDPRWGRNQETYGEDPYMSGVLAQWFVKGLQGDHPRYIMTNAGCKHFDAYGGPENIPESRHQFNAKVTDSDLRMTFLPAFKACVEAGTYSLMCSYNSVNGIPACANKKLLTDILRTEWGFKGYVISDEGAIEDIMVNHNYTHTVADTAAAAVNAGCNLEDGPGGVPIFNGITDAYKQGKLAKDTLWQSVKPLFYTRMRLGLFDPPDMNPYSKLDPSKIVQSAQHRELAITSAMRSYVLLKNEGSILPLKAGFKVDTLAIVGPMADNINGIFGGYAPEPDPKYIVTPRKGLSNIGNTVRYAAGCNDTSCTDYQHGQEQLKQAVQGADMVVVCLGTGFNIESEGNDRRNTELPGKQALLLFDAVTYASGKPVILLLFNAGPLNITYAIQESDIQIIMACFFPAQGAGEALRRMFYMEGEASNPAARLPATWPLSVDPLPAITNYSMDGRTYRYWHGFTMFPFGYGLSYSKFMYSNLAAPTQVTYKAAGTFNVTVDVNNVGPFDGEEVVQLYVSWTNYSVPSIPKIQLVGFNRLFIKYKSTVHVTITVKLDTLNVWDPQKQKMTVLKGDYMLFAGGQQPYVSVTVPSNVLKVSFRVL